MRLIRLLRALFRAPEYPIYYQAYKPKTIGRRPHDPSRTERS